MANNPTNESLVIATFNSNVQAENAVEALHDVGFTTDQIRYSAQFDREGFLENVKDMLIFPDERQDESTSDVATMLQNMGIDRDEIQYYSDAFKSGQFVVVVRPDNRDQEATDILHRHGGVQYHKK